MGKFKTETFMKESKSGEIFRTKIDFYLSADAEFYFKPEEGLSANCAELIKDRKKDYGCHFGRNHNIYCPEYGALKKLIGDAIDLLLKTDEKVERVIAYSFHFTGNYYLGVDKNIYPNGYLAGDLSHVEARGKWAEILNDDSSHGRSGHYAMKLFAHVVDKYTYSNGKLEKIVYKSAEFREGFNSLLLDKDDNPNYGERLNAFMNIGRDFSMHNKFEIPYTEDRAKYFYDIFIGLCTLNERLKTLNNAEFLMKMIAENKNLLTMN